MISRSIIEPVRSTVEVIDRIAGGDLCARIAIDSRDEIGHLADGVNHMVEDMNRVFSSRRWRQGSLPR